MSRAAEGMVLVINSGSSSIKYQLLDPESSVVAASGTVERIGEDNGGSSITPTARPPCDAG